MPKADRAFRLLDVDTAIKLGIGGFRMVRIAEVSLRFIAAALHNVCEDVPATTGVRSVAAPVSAALVLLPGKPVVDETPNPGFCLSLFGVGITPADHLA